MPHHYDVPAPAASPRAASAIEGGRGLRKRFRTIRDRIYGDFLMPSGLGSYRRVLESVQRAGYETTSVERFWRLLGTETVDPARRYLILRHDIDTDPQTAAQMWEIERDLGIAGSYYFRLSTLDLDLMGAIARGGGEVGYHYEELATVAKAYRLRDRESLLRHVPEAQDRFRRNLEKLREKTGLSMRVVASHGDFANRLVGLANWAILVDQRIRREADIDLEVYDDAFMRHVSSRHADTEHPRRWAPGELTASLDARLPIVYVLVHPRNWQARPIENARDDLRRLGEGLEFRLRPSRRSGRSIPWQPMPGSRPAEADVSGERKAAAGAPATRRGRPVTSAIEASPSSSGSERAPLLVRAPASYPRERRYVMDLVLKEWLGLDYRLNSTEGLGVSISLQDDPREAVLELPDLLFATREADWLTERSMPTPPLPRMRIDWHSLDSPDRTGARLAESPPVPVLYAEPGAPTELFRRTSTGIAFAADIFGSVFYLISRYEEVARPYRDEHRRYPSYASLASIEGFVVRPIVDEYVDALWAAIHEMWPMLTRPSTAFRLRLTHDVDRPWAALGQPTSAVVRGLGGDLIRRRNPTLAGQRTGSLLAARVGRLDGDPYNTFDLLMDTSERHGLRSTFYFLAGNTAGAIDGTYSLSDPPIRRLLKRIHDRGHDIGLHASYDTYRSPELIEREFTALKHGCAAAGFDQPTWGVRQHYLRFEIPTTWRCHESAGLDHDSTLGFADHIGFRAGTCREFPTFDLLERRALRLRERPLVVMDATLFGYQALHPDLAASRAQDIVDACRRHRGDAVLLYHNDTLNGTRLRAHYQDLVEDLLRPGWAR
jgi:peptidoglycan/xylan/chitin deacetylase (PgdA/CDA1 family)